MSYRALNWAWESDLPTSQKFVLVALADMSDEHESCFPGQERLGKMIGATDRTVRAALVKLEDAGYISRTQRRGADGMRTSDRYQLHVNRKNFPVVRSPENDDRVTGNLRQPHRKQIPGNPQRTTREPPDVLRITERFDEFWKSYPVKKGKEPARKAFEKALKSGADFDAVMAGLEAYKRDLGQIVGGKTLEGRTPKWAQGWLNDRRWEDEPDGPSLDDQWRDAMGGPTDPCVRLGHLWITDGTCGRCGELHP